MNIDVNNARAVVYNFFPEAQDFQLKPYGSGHIHHTFLVELQNGGTFILQKINTHVFKTPVSLCQNIHLLNKHLKGIDYPFAIAELVTTPDDHLVVEDQNKDHWRIFHYLANTQSFDQATAREQAYEASKAFGIFVERIQNLPQQLITPGIPNFHNCLSRGVQFGEAVRQASLEKLKEINHEIHFFDQHLFCRDWQKLQLPVRLSHNDTKINNILFSEDGKTPYAIIDLDTVMPASPLYDFADMVRTYTSPVLEDAPAEEVDLRLDYFEALCAGFLEGTKDLLNAPEKSVMLLSAFLMVQVQAQRFLADYLNGNIYYQVNYREHNLIRGRNQMALLKSMLAQKEDMQKVLKKYW